MKASTRHVTPASDEAQAAVTALGSKNQTKNYSLDLLCAEPSLEGGAQGSRKRIAVAKTARQAAQRSSLRAQISAFSTGVVFAVTRGDLVLADWYSERVSVCVKRLAHLERYPDGTH